jgi:hypothetical protein
VVDTYIAASRAGDFEAVLALLDPDIVLHADRVAVALGALPTVRGADAVARTSVGRSGGARPVLVNGTAGAVWAPGGHPRVVFKFTIVRGTITAIELIGEPTRLRHLDLVAVND